MIANPMARWQFAAGVSFVSLLLLVWPGATDMLMRTARLLRRTTDDERESIPLSEEMQIAREYLELHAQRFPDRLQVDICLAPQLAAVEVPSLLLQPLVENAALHGLASDAPQVMVRVSAQPAMA